jgi:quercetin dioxygenase-like cupin family protein
MTAGTALAAQSSRRESPGGKANGFENPAAAAGRSSLGAFRREDPGDLPQVFIDALLPLEFQASLTLAKPGGEFPEHADPYTHIFYIIEGEGEAWVEGEKFLWKRGSALTVPAGQKHGYRNPGKSDLLLITLNLYEPVG